MARLSYGGDIFSPIRSDLSFNDSISKDGSSGRGSISEDLIKVSSVEFSKSINSTKCLELPKHRRKNDYALPLEEITLCNKIKKVESKSTKRCEDSISDSNLVSITPCVKDEDIDSKLPVKQLPRRSTRSQKSEETAKKETDSKNRNSQSTNKSVSSLASKKMSNNAMLSKFVTVRGGESKKSDHVTNRPKSCSVNDTVTQPEKMEEKENKADSMESSNETAVNDGSSYEIKGKLNEASVKLDELVPSNQTVLYSHLKEKLDIPESKSFPNMDNNLESNLSQKTVFSCATLSDEPTRIQAKIIEKLVSDTIAVEFDVIRQQMYLQQMALLKVLNETREEFESRYSRDTDHLYKIIGELLEENQQLRSAIIARR